LTLSKETESCSQILSGVVLVLVVAAIATPLFVVAVRLGRRSIRSGRLIVAASMAASLGVTYALNLFGSLWLILLLPGMLLSPLIIGVVCSVVGCSDLNAANVDEFVTALLALSLALSVVLALIVAVFLAFCGSCLLNGLLAAGRRRMLG
jgi:hypothetical protein